MTKVADERLGAFLRFQQDINARVIKGSLDPDIVENILRPFIGQKKKLLPFLKENNIMYSHHVESFVQQYTDNTIVRSNFSVENLPVFRKNATYLEMAKWYLGNRKVKVDENNLEKLLIQSPAITLGDFFQEVLKYPQGHYFTFLKVRPCAGNYKKYNICIAAVHAYWDGGRLKVPNLGWIHDYKDQIPDLSNFFYPGTECSI